MNEIMRKNTTVVSNNGKYHTKVTIKMGRIHGVALQGARGLWKVKVYKATRSDLLAANPELPFWMFPDEISLVRDVYSFLFDYIANSSTRIEIDESVQFVSPQQYHDSKKEKAAEEEEEETEESLLVQISGD